MVTCFLVCRSPVVHFCSRQCNTQIQSLSSWSSELYRMRCSCCLCGHIRVPAICSTRTDRDSVNVVRVGAAAVGSCGESSVSVDQAAVACCQSLPRPCSMPVSHLATPIESHHRWLQAKSNDEDHTSSLTEQSCLGEKEEKHGEVGTQSLQGMTHCARWLQSSSQRSCPPATACTQQRSGSMNQRESTNNCVTHWNNNRIMLEMISKAPTKVNGSINVWVWIDSVNGNPI